MCKAAARREFDVVLAWSVDRLGRSLQDLVPFLNDLHAVGVDLYLDQQAIDTTTPSGKAMFHMVGVFAEFERSMIQERIHAGLDRARAEGKQLGRRSELPDDMRRKIIHARSEGVSYRAIAKRFDVSLGMTQRVLRSV